MEVFQYWLILSLLMIILETVLPIAVPLWVGVTGFAVGSAVYFLNIGGLKQALLFCFLVVPITLLGRKLFPIHIENVQDKFMNQRMARLMGQEIILETDMDGCHVIQQKIGETVWSLKGPSMPAGTRVKIVNMDNNLLIVEKI